MDTPPCRKKRDEKDDVAENRASLLRKGLHLFDSLAKNNLDAFARNGGTDHTFKMVTTLKDSKDANAVGTMLTLVDRVAKTAVRVWLWGSVFSLRCACIGQ